MSNDIIQAEYDTLETVSKMMGAQSDAIDALRKNLESHAAGLANGGWQGSGADAFQAELVDEMLPALIRLADAFTAADETTLKIAETLRVAEEDAANQFQIEHVSAEKGFLGHTGDFFSGIWAEGSDTITGLWTAATNPVDTAKGLWYGVTHPGELWEAIKKPYADDWNNGRPWRAIGRGTLAIATTVLGTKGADKAAKAARGASVVDDVGRVATVTDDIGRIGSVSDDAARIAGATDDAARLGSTVDDGARAGSRVTPDEALRNNKHPNAHGFSARDINPGWPTAGRTQNCVKCVQAMDDLLAGNGAKIAETTAKPISIGELMTRYNAKFTMSSRAGIESTLQASGHGSRGIVYIKWQGDGAHVFNVINQNGVIRFIDAQTGKSGLLNFDKAHQFVAFMPTN